ncbi:MAG: hypothetical protein U0939_14570 [Pirellulales bacterium]
MMQTTRRAVLKRTIILTLLAMTTCAAAQDKPAAKPEPRVLRAGAAASNITPFLGGDVVGGFHPYPAQHIHDELYAKCLVLDNGESRVAFVVLDLLGADRMMFDEARKLVTAATGLPGECLIMSTTHTHSAVSALGANRYLPQRGLDEYQQFVARRIADGVRRAINQLEPAQVGWAKASEPREVFNRRWFMKPGTVPVNPFGEVDKVKMNPPRASQDLVEPAGPTDPDVWVLAARTPDGRPIGLLANYSLHYVGGVRGADVSADYYAYFADRLQHLLGADRQQPPFVAAMSNGTSGNINNIDFKKPGESKKPYERMAEVADNVAQAALKAYQSIQWHDQLPLGGRLERFDVAVRRPTEEQLARAREILRKKPTTEGYKATLEEIYAERTVKLNEWPEKIGLPIQAIRVGELAVGGIPNEVFVEIGLDYKQRSPLKPCFIMSMANGYYGYLPTPEHHRLGGYETWLGTNRLEPDASNKILDKLITLTKELAP